MSENIEIIKKIKEKKQFSQLPDSIVEKSMHQVAGDVKKSRALLRKYFGVFLTNKVLKPKFLDERILNSHISTKNRDYELVYSRIFGKESTIIDLGCGVNGFSYNFLPNNIKYIGIEAVGQLVELMNLYFKEKKFNAQAVHMDLFDIEGVIGILKTQKKPRTVLLFNVIDALEVFERDFSKVFLKKIAGECEKIVVSFPVQSLSGKTKFKAKRAWILSFIEQEFKTMDDFLVSGERFLVFSAKI